jgi:hypothetical protein
MEQFRGVLVDCGLSDLGYKGSKFTWSNQDETFMKERLDQAVANQAWCGLLKNREACVMPARTLDHKPLFLRIFYDTDTRTHFQKSFKFEANWLGNEECMEVIKNAWKTGEVGAAGMQPARERLALCQTQLTQWSDRKFHHIDQVI